MIAFGMPGGTEWLVILLIVLIFFGAGRLPDVMSQFGKGIRAFKDGAKDDDTDEQPVIRKKKKPAQLEEPDDLDEEEAAPVKAGAARRKSDDDGGKL